MWLRASCTLEFNAAVPTPFLFMLRPRSGHWQWVGREQYLISPKVPVDEFTDGFGNLCQRLVSPAGPFSIRMTAEIESADAADTGYGEWFVPVEQLPVEVLPFLLPSRYCESDRFAEMAAGIVAGLEPGYNQCAAIVDYIRNTIRYAPGSGQLIISATEVNGKTEAVCRDMAHLGIALCRALSIPARMVVGYLAGLEPMDQHAWFEAYVGGRWYTFDPTQPDLNGGRVSVAIGRDAADVAIFTQFGDVVDIERMDVSVEVLDGPPW